MWLKPESLGSPASNVDTWADSSGNAFDLTATVGLEPIVSSDPIPGAMSDGTKQMLGSTNVLLNAPQGYTLFLVMKENVSTHHEIVGKFGVTPPEDFSGWLLGRNPTTEFGIFGTYDNLEYFNAYYENPDDYFSNVDVLGNVFPGDFDTDIHVNTVVMYPTEVMQGVRWRCRRDATMTDTHWKEGTNQSGYQVLPSPTQTGPFWLFLANPSPWVNSSSGFNGTLYELLMYDGPLSDADISQTEDYLRNKFSILSPKRSYSVPFEVGRTLYNDEWNALAPHASTQAGDLIIILTRTWIDGSLHDYNAVNQNLYVQTRNTGLFTGIDNTASPGSIVRVEWWSRVAQGAVGNVGATVLNNGGSGYALGDQGHISGGDGVARYYVTQVSAGVILSYYIVDQGTGYTTGTNVATTAISGGGTGFTVDITSVDADVINITAVTAPYDTPTHPHMVSMVTYRNLEASQGVRKAVEAGYGIPAYGEVQQDSTYNFSYPPLPLLSPPQVDHLADGSYAANDNEMHYLCFVSDTGDPTITSTVVNEGFLGSISGGSGTSWVIMSMLFYATSADAPPVDVPACGSAATWRIPPLEWSAFVEVPTPPEIGLHTFRFDAGVGPTPWYIVPQLSDSGSELRAKHLKSVRVTGKVTNAAGKGYGYDVGENIVVEDLETGENSKTGPVPLPDTSQVVRGERKQMRVPNAELHTVRIEGVWDGEGEPDRVDEIAYEYTEKGVRR